MPEILVPYNKKLTIQKLTKIVNEWYLKHCHLVIILNYTKNIKTIF